MKTLFDKIKKECKRGHIVPNVYDNKYINQKTGKLVTIDDTSKLSPDKFVYIPDDNIGIIPQYFAYTEKTENGYLIAMVKANTSSNEITPLEEKHIEIIVDENSIRLSDTTTKKSLNDVLSMCNRKTCINMLKSDIKEILKKDYQTKINNMDFSGHDLSNKMIANYINKILIHLKKEPILTFEHKSLPSNPKTNFVKMITKDKLLMYIPKGKYLLDLTKKQLFELCHLGLSKYVMSPTEARCSRCIENPKTIDKKSFKGTYLESFIYKDTNKMVDLLNDLLALPQYESFIKIIKDRKNYKELVTFASDSKTYTKLLLSKTDNMLADFSTKYLVESIPNCNIDDIKFIMHVTKLDTDLHIRRLVDMMPHTRNMPICEMILKMLNKTAIKLTNRLSKIPDLGDILLKNVKTTDLNWLKTYAKTVLKNVDRKSIDERKAIYLNLFMSQKSSLDIILMDKHLSKMLFDENIRLTETIAEANAKFKENIYRNAKMNLTRSTTDMCDMYNKLKELGFAIKEPANLTVDKMFMLHDYYADIIKENQEFVDNAIFDKITTKYKKYEYEDDSLMVIVPASQEEIVNEGLVLHHCVATYVDRHINGHAAILFIRKKNEPNKPFYTMEINPTDNNIAQVRGKFNCAKTPEVTKFVNKYKADRLK